VASICGFIVKLCHSELSEESGVKYSFREESEASSMEEIVSRLNDLDKEIEKTMVRL